MKMTYGAKVVAVAVSGLFGMACERGPQEYASLWSERDVVSERTFLPVGARVEWSIGGDVADTLLLNPTLLSAGAEGATVWDDGRQSVVRISPQGAHLWNFGKQGGGPGEFRSVRSIAHLPDGGVATVDVANDRLTTIDRDGAMTAEVSLEGGGYPLSVAGLRAGGLVLLTDASDYPFLLFDRRGFPDSVGFVVDSLAFPWEPYRDLPMIARQGLVLSVGSGWIFGFISGNGWWRFRDAGDADAFPYAEHTDYPTVVTETGTAMIDGRVAETRTTRVAQSVPAAMGFGARGDTLFVHFGGSSDDRRRLLDLFSLTDGSYYGSVRLPRRATEVAIGPDAIYTLHADPFPVLSRITTTSDGEH